MRLVLALLLAVPCAALTVAAATRPHADVQRNVLVAGACGTGLLLVVLLLAPALRSWARAIADEWRPRR